MEVDDKNVKVITIILWMDMYKITALSSAPYHPRNLLHTPTQKKHDTIRTTQFDKNI